MDIAGLLDGLYFAGLTFSFMAKVVFILWCLLGIRDILRRSAKFGNEGLDLADYGLVFIVVTGIIGWLLQTLLAPSFN